MKKLKQIFLNSKFSFILGTINLIIFLVLISLTIDEFHITYSLIIILGILPSFFYYLIVFLANKFSTQYRRKRIVNLIAIWSIIPYLIYLFFWTCFLFITIALTPEVKLSSYKHYAILDYFPEKIPENYIDASYYHTYRFLQGGEKFILYLKLDSDLIEEYERAFKGKSIEPHKNIPKEKFYENTPYSDKSLNDDFNIYYLETNCDNSGYCNHGFDKHVVINNNTNEIIFYYQSW